MPRSSDQEHADSFAREYWEREKARDLFFAGYETGLHAGHLVRQKQSTPLTFAPLLLLPALASFYAGTANIVYPMIDAEQYVAFAPTWVSVLLIALGCFLIYLMTRLQDKAHQKHCAKLDDKITEIVKYRMTVAIERNTQIGFAKWN